MKSEIIIRPAKESDYDEINQLYRQDNRDYEKQYPKRYKQNPRYPIARGSFINSVDPIEKDWKHFVATIDGAFAGYIELLIDSYDGNRILNPSKTVEVSQLTVMPQYRRMGVATQLLDYAQVWAKQKNITTISLMVYDFREPAQALYKKLGYKPMSHNLYKDI